MSNHFVFSCISVGRALRHTVACLALGLASQSSMAQGACKSLTASGNPEYPPYLWVDPTDGTRLMGATADLMRLVGKEIGVNIDVKYVGPWARVQEDAKLGRIDLIAGAFLTTARLDYMDYIYPDFQATASVVWTLESKKAKLGKWEDLIGQHGVTVINNSFGDKFDQFARKNLRLSTVSGVEQAFKMLNQMRADYLIYEEAPAMAYLSVMNVGKMQAMKPPISSESLYLTVPFNSICNTPELRGRLAKAMRQFKDQDVMKKMLQNNIQLWRAQQI